MDVLQAATRATWKRSSGSTSTRCSRTGPLPDQIAEQLAAGRTLTVELDAWFLPDTAATSYRTEHVKTYGDPRGDRPRRRAAPLLPQRRSLYELVGRGLPRRLPARCGRSRRCCRRTPSSSGSTPARASRATRCARPRASCCATTSAASVPANPFERFGDRLADDLPALLAGDDAGYHAYAFATVRMVGAGFEISRVARRLAAGRRRRAPAAAAMGEIVDGSKVLVASSSLAGGRSTRRRRSRRSQRPGTEAIVVLDEAVADAMIARALTATPPGRWPRDPVARPRLGGGGRRVDRTA